MTLIAEEIGGVSFSLSAEQAAMVKERSSGSRVHVGFRPQAVQVGARGPGALHGTVYAFNPFVTYGVLILDVGGTRVRVLTKAAQHFEVDQEVFATVDPNDIYLFDAATTKNLVGSASSS